MSSQQYLVIIAILGWGLGSFLNKIANDNMHPIMVSATATVVFIILLSITFSFYNFNRSINIPGVLAGIGGGLCMCAASLAYFYSLKHGKAGVTTALTSMYPIITLILSMVFLKEQLTIRQWFGMGFAILSFILLSIK
jgi:drug/metabolite transporter (DMT)-like permease